MTDLAALRCVTTGFLWVYHSFSHVVADGFAAFKRFSPAWRRPAVPCPQWPGSCNPPHEDLQQLLVRRCCLSLP